jgi:SulP family sulfate permease
VQVSGPTAAFVVILAPVSQRFGVGGLLLAPLMAGAILFAMGIMRLGRFIEFVPYPVTTGFTAGIAEVIATLQVKDLLGLTVKDMPEHFVERVQALALALPTVHWPDVVIGALTLAVLAAWPLITRRVPAPLVALLIGAGAQPQPLRVMARAGWADRNSRVAVYGSFERAVEEVRKAFE